MIQVRRPVAVPTVLHGRGTTANKLLCASYDTAASAYSTGTASFSFDSGIYAADEIKTALRLMQHDKCCFCESKITHISYGDVEHFRPKAACRQRPGSPLIRPGYYWLAYEWTNLFLSCQLCNQRHKENLFPLRVARNRARSHHHLVAAEQALFVNPEEDCSRYIGFRQEYAYPRRASRRGTATIDALGLNRPELVERRRDRLALVTRLREVRALLTDPKFHDQATKLDATLFDMSVASAEYTAMVRSALA